MSAREPSGDFDAPRRILLHTVGMPTPWCARISGLANRPTCATRGPPRRSGAAGLPTLHSTCSVPPRVKPAEGLVRRTVAAYHAARPAMSLWPNRGHCWPIRGHCWPR